MSPEEIAAVLLGLPEVTEEEPFEPDVPVYKVAGKVFAIYQPGPLLAATLSEHGSASFGVHVLAGLGVDAVPGMVVSLCCRRGG